MHGARLGPTLGWPSNRLHPSIKTESTLNLHYPSQLSNQFLLKDVLACRIKKILSDLKYLFGFQRISAKCTAKRVISTIESSNINWDDYQVAASRLNPATSGNFTLAQLVQRMKRHHILIWLRFTLIRITRQQDYKFHRIYPIKIDPQTE